MRENLRRALFWAGALLPWAVLAAAWLAVPGAALAAEAGEVHHKAFSLTEELFKVVNTLIVVAIVYKLAAKPLRNYLADRREGISRALADSQRAREEAEKMLEEQRGRVADLEAELSRVRRQGEEERRTMGERLQADQEAQARRLLEQTRNTIELETMKARADLQDEAARLALGLAEEMLKKELGPEDQKRFVEDYLARLGDRNGGTR